MELKLFPLFHNTLSQRLHADEERQVKNRVNEPPTQSYLLHSQDIAPSFPIFPSQKSSAHQSLLPLPKQQAGQVCRHLQYQSLWEDYLRVSHRLTPQPKNPNLVDGWGCQGESEKPPLP